MSQYKKKCNRLILPFDFGLNMSCAGKYDLKLNQMNINANVIKHELDWWRNWVRELKLCKDKEDESEDKWPLNPDEDWIGSANNMSSSLLKMCLFVLFFLSKSYFLLMMYWNVHLFWFSPCCQLSLCSDRLVEVFYHIDLLQQSHFSVASFHQNTSAKREYYEEEHVAIFHIIDTGCWICTEVWLVML